ncbi:MAG TPA: GGDEF domain-containing protein [Acidimicrobiales bacterium]|nr:GGDEF domain-containing protein [Acidimicrobiales bacterium]
MHEQLRHLDPDERDALLDLVTGQIGDIVALWAELVRGVVSPEAATGERLASVADERTVRSDPLPATGGDVRVLPDPPEASPYRRQTPQPPAVTAERDGLTRDELTGVLNRQAGFASLERELERCRQSGARFIVGYLNVDGLRHVNEAHGPRAGDELLRKVTSALRATLRSYDVILRLGGDEFLFSLPGADMATAEQRLKEFRVILAEEAPGGSASVGFAELRRGDCLDELIARADASLRQSRRPGRRHN